MAKFLDSLDSDNAARWMRSDGWGNGGVFLGTWDADQIAFAAGVMTLTLQDVAGTINSGEFRTTSNYGYGSFSAAIKASAVPGTITGFFT